MTVKPEIEIVEKDGARFYNGLPSVTTVLPAPDCPATMTPQQWERMLARAARFGKICHEGAAQIAEGEEPCIEATEGDAEKIGRLLTTYWEWFDENVKTIWHVEEPFLNDEMGYGGTPDLVATLNDSDTPAIIDIKAIWPPSARQQGVYEIQLVAQGKLVNKAYRRISLRLRKEAPDKPPQTKEYPIDDDRAILAGARFLNYLTGYKLEQEWNGGKT